MKITENCETRERVVQGDAYVAAGYEDFSFSIPRPFKAEHFQHLYDELGVQPGGMANTANQVLAENLGNNMAARIKAILKANSKLEEGEDPEDLPGQEDMDKLYGAYDFSGIRTGGAGSVSLTPFQQALYKRARTLIRLMLKKGGYQNMSAPVTVAKNGEEPKKQQISRDIFESEVEELVQGEGEWGEKEQFMKARDGLIKAAQKDVTNEEEAAESVGLVLAAANSATSETVENTGPYIEDTVSA